MRQGAIVLIGSGETAAVGRTAVQWLRTSGREPRSVAVLETPAGFEPNTQAVAARWTHALHGELPKATFAQIAARKRGTRFDPDDPEIARPILGADLVAIGAGSPIYAIRQLRASATWENARAAHLLGASFFLASAAAIAAGRWSLPVYEIFKVGDDLRWDDGLGLSDIYGLTLAVVPHWDDTSGGEALDTSRCFMGEARFAQLLAMLPASVVVVGLDEHTGLAIDLATEQAEVIGRGGVTLVRGGRETTFERGATFAVRELGPFAMPDADAHITPEMRDAVRAARASERPPSDVRALIADRERARSERDFDTADRLRDEIAERGFKVDDTPAGPRVHPDRA